MKLIHISLVLRTALLAQTVAASNTTGFNGGQPIIIDTDLFSDCDDAGAIAIANVLHNCGLADLRGIAINTHSHYGALAANVRTAQAQDR